MSEKPYVIIEWNDTETEAIGWLCVHNFVNHYCGGGTRMHPTVTKEEVERLARAMGYKYKACRSTTTGGCKGGIRYDYKAPDADDVLRRYLTAMAPYLGAGVSIGGDLGVDYGKVLKILDDLDIGLPRTKAMKADPKFTEYIANHDRACAMRYDGFLMYDMITGYGCAFSLDEAWKFMGRKPEGARVVVQGFGCVGASLAWCLDKMGYKVVGLADANLLVHCPDGLDVKKLVQTRRPKGEMDPAAFDPSWQTLPNDQWLDLDCDILVPAALEDVINESNAGRVKAALIVEAANIPVTPEADRILADKGVEVCVDFVANMGGIRIYDVLVFGLVPPDPEAIVRDTEAIIRENTRLIFDEARKQGRTQRQVALEIFAPEPSDTPDN